MHFSFLPFLTDEEQTVTRGTVCFKHRSTSQKHSLWALDTMNRGNRPCSRQVISLEVFYVFRFFTFSSFFWSYLIVTR